MAREYLSASQALDGSEDSATILQKASLVCINKKREARALPPLSCLELDQHLGRMVTQAVNSVRNSNSHTSPEEIMERFNDELVGVTPAEREQFRVLDSWKVRERMGELNEWPDRVLEALEAGDLRSDYWGTEVNRKRQDLMDYLLYEPGDEAADKPGKELGPTS
ncbi:MAG: hypothetical protein Q9169_000476 [Polycauliona sp. 2 TL-2023]